MKISLTKFDAAAELLLKLKRELVGLELVVVPQGRVKAEQGALLSNVIDRPVNSFVRALIQLILLRRVVLIGLKEMSVLSVLDLEE